MPTDPRPTTPQEDLAAWHGQADPARDRLLTPDLVALAQNGATVLVAAQGDGRPLVGFGVACRALPDGRLRMILNRSANARLLVALEAGSRVAATFTGSGQHHRAFQVKADRAAIGPARSDDLPEVERQVVLFCDGLIEIGFTRELAAGWLSLDRDDLVAVEVLPERVFTQTPGPGAGAELTR